MNSDHEYKRLFGYGSLLPLVQFILGVYILFLIITENNSQAFFTMLIAFVIYVTNNILINLKGNTSIFDEYLEDMASFTTFNLTIIIFGLIFFKDDMLVLTILLFFSMCQILSLARNWVMGVKNSKGWPIPLNGLFFPLTFFIYMFYLQGFGDSIFVLFYVIVGFLSITEYNFLGYEESSGTEYSQIKEESKKESLLYNSDDKDVQEKISEKLNDLIKGKTADKRGMLNLFFGKF